MLKSRRELENFSGKTAVAVRKDFDAKAFLITLCAAYAHPIEPKVVEEDDKIVTQTIAIQRHQAPCKISNY